jgi:hypothetical protein
MKTWLRSLCSEAIFAIWVSLSGVSTLLTFFPFFPMAGRVRPILIGVTLVGFAWGNFRVFQKQQARIAALTTDSEQKVSFLENQVRDLLALQAQAKTQEASAAEEKQQAVANQLAVFLSQGREIRNRIEFNNPQSLQDKKEWERRIVDYLTANLGKPHAVRFQNPSRRVRSYPVGMAVAMLGEWGDVAAKMEMLNDFISEHPRLPV